MKTKYLLFIVLAAISVAHAQVGDTKKSPSGPTRSVVNEDRGRACIVVDNTLPTRQGAKLTVEPQQYSIFLGNGWAADSLHSRESSLSNLLSNATDSVEVDYLAQFGWKSSYSVGNYEERLVEVGEGRTVSDLQIQSVLSDTVRDNPMARQADNITYIIYLEPSLVSTLGPIVGGKHYLAYYNAFNKSDLRLRYVVVPYEANLKTARQRALTAFLSAVLQPDCR